MFLYTWDNKKGTVMPDLRIKPNIENGDLPEDFDGHSVEKLHKVIDRKIKILEDSNKLQESCNDEDNEMNWEKQSYNPSLLDIFNPLKMKEALDKANGHTNKDKE